LTDSSPSVFDIDVSVSPRSCSFLDNHPPPMLLLNGVGTLSPHLTSFCAARHQPCPPQTNKKNCLLVQGSDLCHDSPWFYLDRVPVWMPFNDVDPVRPVNRYPFPAIPTILFTFSQSAVLIWPYPSAPPSSHSLSYRPFSFACSPL